MHPDFQQLLVDPQDHTRLTYTGEQENNRWTNGKLTNEQGAEYPVTKGVPEMAGANADPWGNDQQVADYFAKLGRTPAQVVKAGYEQAAAGAGPVRHLEEEIQQVLATGGPILEIGCGHGGGLTPLMIGSDLSAPILMADPGRWVLQQWQELAFEKNWQRLSCVQALAEHLPFPDNSLGAITTFGGYSNSGPGSPALIEAHRVLKPGGLLLMLDARPDPACFRRFPADIRDKIKEKYPAFGVGYPKIIQGSGFAKGSYIETGRRPMAGRESMLAKLARQHKVRVEILVCKVVMEKAGD